MSDKSIRRNLMLKEFDIKETPDGEQVVFSIKFVKKNGEIVFMPRAVACGLKMNLSKNRMRGVLPIDNLGNKISHPTPVGIDNIIEFNDRRVRL